MRILITGNLGFVGTETEKYLGEQGHEVIGYDIMAGCDIRNRERFDEIVSAKKPDRILHLAAIARFADADRDPKLAFETNALGTKNVVIVAKKHFVPLVYASTGSVYMPITQEPPITETFEARGNSVYGCTKYLGEIYVREIAHPWIILRYAHLYGKEKRNHGLIGGFYERIKRGLAPTLYGGKQSNDFTYIRDIARANALALTASWDKWNEIYNIGTGEEITAEDAGKLVCEFAGWKGEVDQKDGRAVDPPRFVYNISKAEEMLNFRADFTFRQGLTDMFADDPSLSKPMGKS